MQIGTLYPSYQKDKPAQHQFYAACAIYQATADTTYLDMALQLRVDSVEREGWPVINWDNPYWLGIMCIAHSGPSAEIRATAMARLETMFMTWINELAPIKYGPSLSLDASTVLLCLLLHEFLLPLLPFLKAACFLHLSAVGRCAASCVFSIRVEYTHVLCPFLAAQAAE